MIDGLVLGAALLSGLLGSLHCAAMCGGIAVGAGVGLPREQALAAAWRINLGRLSSYVMAGALVGGVGAGLIEVFRLEALQIGLRMAVGAVLILAALRLLWPQRWSLMNRPGYWLWARLAPLRARVFPADTPMRQLGFGLIWGWLPCGLSLTLMTAAWLSADALQGAAIMASFGLGTLLTMLPLSWSGARGSDWLQRRSSRRVGAALMLAAGTLTVTAPWLAQHPAAHAWLSALGCRTLG